MAGYVVALGLDQGADLLYCLWMHVYTVPMYTHTRVHKFVKYVKYFAGLYAWNASPSYHMDSCASLPKELQGVIVVGGDSFSLHEATLFDIKSKLKW